MQDPYKESNSGRERDELKNHQTQNIRSLRNISIITQIKETQFNLSTVNIEAGANVYI